MTFRGDEDSWTSKLQKEEDARFCQCDEEICVCLTEEKIEDLRSQKDDEAYADYKENKK